MNKKKKLLTNLAQGFFLALFFITALLTGFLLAHYNTICVTEGLIENGSMIFYFYGLAVYFAAVYLQMIIHECGHLVFGLISGYRFLSIRFASFMLIRSEGRIKLKRYSLAGTGGQCLMAPPETADGRTPIALYHLGGCFLNLISAGIFAVLWLLTDNPFISFFFLTCSIWGVSSALQNGIPMSLPTVSNDGSNVLRLMKNPAEVRDITLSIKITEGLAENIRLKDMPEEWFEINEAKDGKINAEALIRRSDRLVDESRFEEAKELLIKLLESDSSAIFGVRRAYLVNMLICCEAFGNNDPEVYTKYITAEHNKLCRALEKSIGMIRTNYVCSTLVEPDYAKAKKALDDIKRIKNTYPYPADYENELDMIVLAGKLAKERQSAKQ